MTELESIYQKYEFLRKLNRKELADLLVGILAFLICPPKNEALLEECLIGSVKKAIQILDKNNSSTF